MAVRRPLVSEEAIRTWSITRRSNFSPTLPRTFNYPGLMRIFLLVAVASVVWGQGASTDPVVLTVGSEKITKSQFEQIIDTLPEQQRSVGATPEGRRQLAERVAELKTMAAEARAKKLDQEAGVKTKLALQADQVLANALYQSLTEGAVSDADMRAFYDQHKSEWEDAKVKHILVRFQGSRVPVREGQKDLTEEEALAKTNQIKAKITGGAKFEDVAKADSDDTGSGENGGDLGSISHGATVPEFEAAVFSQPVGKLGDPVKTQFGYHLLVVDSRTAKTFDEVKETVSQRLKPELGQKGIDALVKKASVTYDDGYFGKPEAAPAPPPAK